MAPNGLLKRPFTTELMNLYSVRSAIISAMGTRLNATCLKPWWKRKVRCEKTRHWGERERERERLWLQGSSWTVTDDDDIKLHILRCQLTYQVGTKCDQCLSMVQCCFTSTETVRLIRTESPGRQPRLSHSSWTLKTVAVVAERYILATSSVSQAAGTVVTPQVNILTDRDYFDDHILSWYTLLARTRFSCVLGVLDFAPFWHFGSDIWNNLLQDIRHSAALSKSRHFSSQNISAN